MLEDRYGVLLNLVSKVPHFVSPQHLLAAGNLRVIWYVGNPDSPSVCFRQLIHYAAVDWRCQLVLAVRCSEKRGDESWVGNIFFRNDTKDMLRGSPPVLPTSCGGNSPDCARARHKHPAMMDDPSIETPSPRTGNVLEAIRTNHR